MYTYKIQCPQCQKKYEKYKSKIKIQKVICHDCQIQMNIELINEGE